MSHSGESPDAQKPIGRISAAVAVLLTLALGIQMPAFAEEGSKRVRPKADVTHATSQIHNDVVIRFEEDSHGMVGVQFEKHAVVYFLNPSREHFAEWLARLKESREAGRSVDFTYDVSGQEFASVEFAN